MKKYVFEYAADRIVEYYEAMASYMESGNCETLAQHCALHVDIINKAVGDYLNGIIEVSYAMEKICNPARFIND